MPCFSVIILCCLSLVRFDIVLIVFLDHFWTNVEKKAALVML